MQKKRTRMPAVDDEMRRIAALLSAEVLRWPKVTAKPMFGMQALFRGKKIFAALPATRAIGTPRSIAYKANPANGKKPAKMWETYEVGDDPSALRGALDVLERAFDAAVAAESKRGPRRPIR